MRNVKCKKCANFKHDWCEKVLDSPDPELVRDCKHYCTLTNGEKIRNMTDEELAAFLADHLVVSEFDANKSLHMDWLLWLSLEVSEDA